MRCAKRHRNEATIHFTPVVDGKPQKTVHLCKDCAPNPGAKSPGARSIEAIYGRVTPEEFARLQNDAKAAASFFNPNLEELLEQSRHELAELADPEKLLARRREEQERGDPYLFIGTDWHALHFLLTGDSELKPQPLPPLPLWNVVCGGTETPWPCSRGHVRLLTPDEVRAVADALTNISVQELRSRFSVASFNAAQIPHPGRARWTDEQAESIFKIYPRVVTFFQSAARDGDIILLSFD
jgi:hypothetical protein